MKAIFFGRTSISRNVCKVACLIVLFVYLMTAIVTLDRPHLYSISRNIYHHEMIPPQTVVAPGEMRMPAQDGLSKMKISKQQQAVSSGELIVPSQKGLAPRDMSATVRVWSGSHDPKQELFEGLVHVAEMPPSLSPAKSGGFFITTGITGALGNRMFEYAALLGIAHRNQMIPFYSSSSKLQDIFRVTHIHDWLQVHFKVVRENFFSSYDRTFEKLEQTNTMVMQYFQSWKYFDFMRETIKQEFTFKEHVRSAAQKILSEHSTGLRTQTRVGIHVRRGDMLTHYHIQKGYHVAPASYIMKAMDYMRHKYHDVIFIVVSDDPAWCENVLNTTDYFIADPATAEVHMAVLALCDHVIMTVGTYGWWGGYLSGGEVLYYWDPKDLLHNPPLPVEIKHPEDFFPPSWIPLAG